MTTLIKHNKPNRGDEIIIPYLAIENNINFIMLNGGVGDIELMDGTKCKSISCTPIKFDDAGDDIYRIYGIGKEAWKMAWLKRVHAMSDEIVKLKLDFNARISELWMDYPISYRDEKGRFVKGHNYGFKKGREVSNYLKLRDYQEVGITRLRNALTNHKHVIFSACVSYGKTVIMSFMAKGAVEKGNKVLIVSHRSELMTQTGGTLERVGIQAEYISPKHRNIPKGLVVSAMAQTLRRRLEKPEWVEWVKSVSLCLIDEAHSSDADYLFESGLLDDKYVVGLTGTPMRSGNQRQLGMNYEEIIETAQIQDMMDRGNITKLRTFTVDAPDLSKVNTDYRTGDFDSRQMGAVFNKSVQYKGVIENYMRICPMKKAICFDATQANAIRMCAEFNEAGIPAKFLISGIDKNKPDELELYEKYKHLTGNREQLIKDFHDDKFTVICNSGILSTGYDETSIEVCILNRATQSVQFYIQATGRAIRLHPNKTEAFLLDFGGNISRLGKFEKERKWALWHNKGKCEGIQGVKECKQCGKYIAITASECPFCGYVYPTEKEIRIAELQELVGDLKFEQMTPTQFFQYAELKGYNTYWAIRQLYIRNTESDFRKAMKECGYSSKFIWGYIKRNKKITL